MSRHYSRKVDDNQGEIVDALRRFGVVVQSLAALGHGVPDLLCGYQGRTVLLEVKDGSKPPSKRMLTEDETRWHLGWRDVGGPLHVVESVEEAVLVVTGKRVELHGRKS